MICKYCGKEFIHGGENKKVYCSKQCMQKSLSEQAKRRRSKETKK